MKTLLSQAAQRKQRVRAKLHGTTDRPRLAIKITNKHIIAQVINDDAGSTLAYASTVNAGPKGTMTQKAEWIGKQIAVAAKKHKVNKVVFDRGTRIYHGRMNSVADAARKEGLEF